MGWKPAPETDARRRWSGLEARWMSRMETPGGTVSGASGGAVGRRPAALVAAAVLEGGWLLFLLWLATR